jgi:hypothetical protein
VEASGPTGGGVVLALKFERTVESEPRADEIASVLDDVEGLYRVVPAAAALGVPVVALLADYRGARAEEVSDLFPWLLDPSAWKRVRRSFPPPDLEELQYLAYRWRRERNQAYGQWSLYPPENPMQVRRLTLGSPLEFWSYIPAAYCAGFMLTRFLRALEERFNMADRIRTERLDLEARRAEREADTREAEVREERAARELAGLRREGGPFQLIEGEVEPERTDDADRE